MGYERTPGDRYGSGDNQDNGGENYGRQNFGKTDFGGDGNRSDYGRDYTYSSARDYAAARGGERDGQNRSDQNRFDQRPSNAYGNQDRDRGYGQDRSYGRSGGDRGRQDEQRGFLDRAGDEVRSWFGDEDAERRRKQDEAATDRDYATWRQGQIHALDRDYDEYRSENQKKFHNEFSSWRTDRQGQRSSLDKVTEHQEVVGSDGQHIGTVDKVRGDKIILTKTDKDAGGHHHSIPSRWIQSVEDKVTLRKTADEAQSEWKDEERRDDNRGALFGEDGDRYGHSRFGQKDDATGPHTLNRSFSGTYPDDKSRY